MKVQSEYEKIAQNPLRYLYEHVLPIETTCRKCRATLLVDSINDFRYNMGSPPGASKPYTHYLTIRCPVCNTDNRFEALRIFEPVVQGLFTRSIKNYAYSDRSDFEYKHPNWYLFILLLIPSIIVLGLLSPVLIELLS